MFLNLIKLEPPRGCLICSEHRDDTIHIFGVEGRRLQLAEKLEDFMAIKIFFWDNLPKSLCLTCLDCVLRTAQRKKMRYGKVPAKDYDSEETDTASETSMSDFEEERKLLPMNLSKKSWHHSSVESE